MSRPLLRGLPDGTDFAFPLHVPWHGLRLGEGRRRSSLVSPVAVPAVTAPGV